MPWILFFALSKVGLPAPGVFAGFLFALYLPVTDTARGRSVKLVDWTTLAFFAIAGASVAVGGSTVLLFWKYCMVLVWSMFAVMAWASILLGAPFTLQFARESTPSEFWPHPDFIRGCLILALVWAIVFTLNVAIVAAAVGPLSPPLFAIFLPMATTVGAMVFTARYKTAAQRNRAAVTPQTSAR